MNQFNRPKYLDEICANCGCTFGSHHAGVSPWPRNYCPGEEGSMNWENGPGTTFKSTGQYKGGGFMNRIKE